MGILVGLYEIVKFFKRTQESTHLHDTKENPQRYQQGDGHIYIHTHNQSILRDKLSLLWFSGQYDVFDLSSYELLSGHKQRKVWPTYKNRTPGGVWYKGTNQRCLWNAATSALQQMHSLFEQSIPVWNRWSFSTCVGIQYWQKIVLIRNQYILHTYVRT